MFLEFCDKVYQMMGESVEKKENIPSKVIPKMLRTKTKIQQPV